MAPRVGCILEPPGCLKSLNRSPGVGSIEHQRPPSSEAALHTRRTVPGIDLFWLPLGAGGWFVRLNGLAYEALAARLARRARQDLYHSALEVTVPEGRYVVEMAPVWATREPERGVVAEGPVGMRVLGRSRMFRYEVRRWRDGVILDVAEAVGGPRRLTGDLGCARRVLDLVAEIPTPVWGRDELGVGEMWNSNSLTSWLVARGGLDPAAARPPAGGRAPGWDAGLAVASGSSP